MSHQTGTGKYEQMLVTCKNLKPIPTAVAHPCEESALSGAIEAAHLGIIVPILVGPRQKIEGTAASAGIDLTGFRIVDTPTAAPPPPRQLNWCARLRRNF